MPPGGPTTLLPGGYLEPCLFTLMDRWLLLYLLTEPGFRTGSAGSKAKAMDPEIACNQNYDDYYANDGEDVHSALLRSVTIACGVLARLCVSVAIGLITSFRLWMARRSSG